MAVSHYTVCEQVLADKAASLEAREIEVGRLVAQVSPALATSEIGYVVVCAWLL